MNIINELNIPLPMELLNTLKKLSIPMELINIIIDYCFDKPIQNKINNSHFSRKNGLYEYDLDWNNNNFNTNLKYIKISPSNNTWIVSIPHDSLYLKASNCYICGNYISHTCSNNIRCNC